MFNKFVVFISSGQPSANPRLVKEAIALSQAGYYVKVIYVPLSPWADAFDEQLFQKHNQIKFIRAGYHPHQQKWLYRWARVRRKILSCLFRWFGDLLNVADYSTILSGQELLKSAKQHKAGLYIAHNLGALPVVVKAAHLHKAKSGFDAEDFHRGEFAADIHGKKQIQLIENKYLPQVNYFSVASPLIGKVYKALFPEISPVVINNVFPLSKLSQAPDREKAAGLRLFWFSQTIGKNRGIEQVLKAMGIIKDMSVSLTLLGNLSTEMKVYLLNTAANASLDPKQLHFMSPVPEDRLFKIAAGFDVGIGSEVPNCLNREYCLTNKIFTYLLAGNALILSDTKAQKRFLEENPGVGLLYKQNDAESLANVLIEYSRKPELLKLHQLHARKLAETKFNWEIESEKFKAMIRTTFCS